MLLVDPQNSFCRRVDPAQQQAVHDGELCAALLPSQSAGAVTGFAAAQALVVAAAERKRVRNGDRLPTLLLAELWNSG